MNKTYKNVAENVANSVLQDVNFENIATSDRWADIVEESGESGLYRNFTNYIE